MLTSTVDLDYEREDPQKSESQKAHKAAMLPMPAVGKLRQLGCHSVWVLHRSTARETLHMTRSRLFLSNPLIWFLVSAEYVHTTYKNTEMEQKLFLVLAAY